MSPTELVFTPEREARAACAGTPLRLRLLRPPYAAIGCVTLRVLRVREDDLGTELVCGYDTYERLG